jgi:electron transport complex protein RnfD
MWLIFCCAGLGVLQSALTDGGTSFIVALAALCSAVLVELLITRRKHGLEKIRDGSAAASGLVLALLLPNQIHPVYAALGALFAMTVVKHSFGGLGSNWLNPALAGWLFVRFSWPAAFNTALEGAPSGVTAGSLMDGRIVAFLNNNFFSVMGIELPFGYIDLLIPRAPGIIADRGLLALLLGTIIIIALRIYRSWIPAVFLTVFGILSRMSGNPPFGGSFWNGDVLYALCSGGTVVAAFILATEPTSGAKSRAGILFVAVLGGALSWLIRFAGFELYGCFFALALVNVCTPVIRLVEWRCFYFRKQHPREASPEGPYEI